MKKGKTNPFASAYRDGLWSVYLGECALLNLGFFSFYCMFKMWGEGIHYDKDGHFQMTVVQFFGGAGWIFTLVACIIQVVMYKNKRKDKEEAAKMLKLEEEGKLEEYLDELYRAGRKKPNIVWEFIKAWYKKNCPIITWK